MSETAGRPQPARREEYSEATRLAVVQAARELFGTKGPAHTNVEEIARRARVSPSTVYAKCGGKQGLLETLMETWTNSSVVRQIVEDCRNAHNGRDMLSLLADGYFTIYSESGDIMRIVTEAAASVPSAKAVLHKANARHRKALAEVVTAIRATGELANGLSDDDVVKTIYFHFRFEQLALTIEEFGWSQSRSRDTIRGWVERVILKP